VRELALHILDVVENSLAAGARHITIMIDEDLAADRLTIRVVDDGRGMDRETAQRALDPFYTTRTTRHVGLGLPLFKAAAERCKGSLRLESAPGQGTTVTAEFRHSHIDRAPLGDLPATLLGLLLSDRPAEIRYVHRLNGNEFVFDTQEVRGALGADVPLTHPAVRDWMRSFLSEGEAELHAPGAKDVA
jgi:anti-sigma regulatory factor (Ser/Thr protein kinase)